MAARFGLSLEGDLPPEAARALVQAADEAGAGTVWVACHLFQRDPIVNAAMALAGSSRLSAGLMAMSPLTMHPVHIAMAAAALDEWFPGRVTLCLGVGAPRDLAAVGLAPDKPLRAMHEGIAIVRALLAGEVVQVNGARYQAEGRRLSSGRRDVKIVLAASGPKMLELAGAEADGVLISAATSPAFIARALRHVAAGEARSGRAVHKAALVYAGVSADARDRLRRRVAFVLRGAHHAPNLEAAGTRLDQAELARSFAAEDWASVERLIDDTVMDNHTASGTPEQVKAALHAYEAIGLHEIVLAGVTRPDDLRTLLNVAEGACRWNC
jgi:5,10-methylenetetrahydromethanopterin reductase